MIKVNLSNFAIFILRATLGVIFLVHGLQKLFGVFGGSGIEGFTQMLAGLNFAPANFWAWLVAIIEALGGLFLIFGILPRLISALIAVIMIVAITKIHAANGFLAAQGGFEYQLLILTVCILFILTGGGKFSLLNKW